MTAERVGEALAVRDAYAGQARDDALAAIGTSQGALSAAIAEQARRLSETLARGDVAPLLALSHSYAKTQRRLRASLPPPAALRRDPFLGAAQAPKAPAPRGLRPLPLRPADSGEAASSADLSVPTYLKGGAEASPAADAVEVLAPIAPPSPPVGPPLPRPLRPAYDPPFANSDETLPITSVKTPRAALPFSGARDAAALEAALGLLPEPPKSPAPPAEATVIVGGDEPARSLLFAKPISFPMAVEAYAELRAYLRVRGDDDEETWRRFGIESRERLDALSRRFAEIFAREATTRTVFLREMQRHVAALAGERREP